MANINQFIVNGELTENCTLSEELMKKCTFSVTDAIPIRNNDEEKASDKNASASSRKKDYWQRFLEISYPGAGKNTGIIIPNVVIHHELGDYFNKTAVMMGVSQSFAKLLEVRISAAGATADFRDKKLASDEKYWWTRQSFNDAVEGKEYIRTIDDEGEEYYGSFHDLFAEYPTSVIANVVCSIKMTCEVNKGEEPKKGDTWRAGLKVSMVTPIDSITIPAPQSGTSVKAIAGKKDTMKSGLRNIKRSA